MLPRPTPSLTGGEPDFGSTHIHTVVLDKPPADIAPTPWVWESPAPLTSFLDLCAPSSTTYLGFEVMCRVATV